MSRERNAHLFIITSLRLLLRVQTAAYFRDLFDFFGLWKLGAALGEAVHHLWGHLFVFTVSLYS